MIGHFVLFIAALVAGITAALGFPTSTASEDCATRIVLTQSASHQVLASSMGGC